MSPISGHSIFKILSHSNPSRHHVSKFRLFSLFKRSDKVREVSPYIIVRPKREEYDEILKVMHESYYTEEPTCSALKITPSPILDEMALKAMGEGYSLVAKCKYNGCIVGACINESEHPWDPDMEEKLACTLQDERLKKLLMFNAYMMRAPDLWRCLGVQKIFDMSCLFVKRPHRKKGLAYKLLQYSKTLGADSGFSVIRCDASNHYTARICERLSMQKVAEIPYCSYLDQKLEPIFKPPWPHEGVKIYCDCSPQFSELNRKIQKKSKFFKLPAKRTKEKQV